MILIGPPNSSALRSPLITCQAPCRHEFCWLCTGPWKDHGERTGGFYACNRFEAARAAGEINDAVRALPRVRCG